MGSLCSKSSNLQGGHVVLSETTNVDGRPAPPDARIAAAEAAERRLKEAQRKGVHDANPKRGRLAEQLAQQNRGAPEPQLPERIIYD